MTTDTATGRCFCGAVRFAFDGAPTWTGICHCESCRRATSSPMTGYLSVPENSLRWSGAAPARYRSSPDVERWFCGLCGAPMAYRHDRRGGEIDLFAATLDDPTAFRPSCHTHYAERPAWTEILDDLPRHAAGVS